MRLDAKNHQREFGLGMRGFLDVVFLLQLESRSRPASIAYGRAQTVTPTAGWARQRGSCPPLPGCHTSPRSAELGWADRQGLASDHFVARKMAQGHRLPLPTIPSRRPIPRILASVLFTHRCFREYDTRLPRARGYSWTPTPFLRVFAFSFFRHLGTGCTLLSPM